MEKDGNEIVHEEDTRALQEAMSFVVGKRLPLPKNLSAESLDTLEFPNDLSRLSTSELGSMMGTWTTVMAYAQYETARTDIDSTAKLNRFEFERKKLYIALSDMPGWTEERKKSEIHVQTAKLKSDYEISKAKHTMVSAMLGAYSKYYQVLSRELSRRGMDGAEKPPKEEDIVDDFLDDIEYGKNSITKEWAEVSADD